MEIFRASRRPFVRLSRERWRQKGFLKNSNSTSEINWFENLSNINKL
jgi:hypothetical protein